MSVMIRGDYLQDTARFFEEFPEIAEKSAVLAINQTAERKAVPMIRHDAESQVNFPAKYLNDPDRLGVTRRATQGSLEAVITARDRPTSLARFIVGKDDKGFTVKVSKGGSGARVKGFFVNLRRGNTGALGNRGLAIRIADGSEPDRAYKPVKLVQDKYGAVWLLYGPSVDQVVRSVAEESLPAIGDQVADEFFRQFDRLSRNG